MTPPIYQFGSFRLNPAARELRERDQLVALPPRSFDCLTYLVEHRERAIGRDELISAVWGRIDVSDAVLAQTLLRARRAVGDDGNEQRAIRTIPRFGYRWLLPLDDIVEPAAEAALATSPTSAPLPVAIHPRQRPDERPETSIEAAPSRKRRVRHRWLLALVAVAVVAIAIAVAIVLQFRLADPNAAATRSDSGALVLPVEVVGGDRDAAWIRLGAMDYLVSRLRLLAGLKVLPSEQTLLLIGQDANPTDAGTLRRLQLATNANFILAPHATLRGTQWSVLIDAYHAGGMRSYEARAINPLDAANLAINRFVASLGFAENAALPQATAATELVQRMDAALLAGDIAQARALVDSAASELKTDPAVSVRAGQIAFRAGQLDAASALFEPLAAAGPSVPLSARAQAQMGIGAVAVRRGDFDAAAHAYADAIETLASYSGRDAPDLLGTAYTGRGVANGAHGLADAALADFGRARMQLERTGDRVDIASVDVNLGIVEAGRGRYGEAQAAFDRAIATFSRFDVRDNLAAALLGKTDAQSALLDHDGALASSERAWDLAVHLENTLLKSRVAAARIRALLAAGCLDDVQHLLEGLDEVDRAKADFTLLQVRLHLERGNPGQAGMLINAHLAEPDTHASVDGSASAWVLASATAVRRGADLGLLERALARLRTENPSDDPSRVLALELGTAQLLATRSDAEAATHFAAALAEADRRGVPDAVVTVEAATVAWYLDRHEGNQVGAQAGRLAAYADRDYRAARAMAAYYHALGETDHAGEADVDVRKLAGQRDPALPL